MKKTTLKPQISLVIPVKDEEKSLPILYREIGQGLKRMKKSYEIIFIDDGSIDNSYQTLLRLQKKDKKIKIIKFRANFGKAAALVAGFKKAQGKIIITLDADLQDDPKEIPKLWQKLNQGYDLVCGWRQRRLDSLNKKLSSFFFNQGTTLISGVKLHDFNCGLKAFKKAVADGLYLHGELHRFIPVLASKQKFKVTETPVNHRKRRFGQSKYGLERGWRGMVDLLTVLFLTGYAKKPGHFFGKIGLLLFGSGFLCDLYVVYIKITRGTTEGRIPLLLAGILFMVLGVQLLSTGLIAEMIVFYTKKQSLLKQSSSPKQRADCC